MQLLQNARQATVAERWSDVPLRELQSFGEPSPLPGAPR
jgi:hypothetical protein